MSESVKPVVVRLGHGANCSSIGAVVDTLFVGAVVGTAIFAAVAAAMQREPVEIVGGEDAKEPHEGSLEEREKQAGADEEKTP